MKINVSKVIAFTEHRNLKMDGQQLRDELKRIISEEYHNGFRYFITSGAQGGDLIAGEVVAELKLVYNNIYLVCAILFVEQENRYSPKDKQRYFNLLQVADKTKYLSHRYYADASCAVTIICWKMPQK